MHRPPSLRPDRAARVPIALVVLLALGACASDQGMVVTAMVVAATTLTVRRRCVSACS